MIFAIGLACLWLAEAIVFFVSFVFLFERKVARGSKEMR